MDSEINKQKNSQINDNFKDQKLKRLQKALKDNIKRRKIAKKDKT